MTRARQLEVASLARRRGRERHGQFLVEGLRSVEAAVQAGAPLLEVVLTEEAAADPRVAAILERVTPLASVVSARDLERISDTRTAQGIAAVARSITADFAAPGPLPAARSAMVLDGVQDPGNVGTILRAAAWFGVDVVIAGPGTADFESPKVVRASMGGLWDLQLLRTANLTPVLDALANANFELYGADVDGEPIANWRPVGRVALVLGSEAHGLSGETPSRLHGTVSIPPGSTAVGVESLNVAVAAGILLHHWRRAGVSG